MTNSKANGGSKCSISYCNLGIDKYILREGKINMNRVLNVAITGYYGTGSSAVIDLLREYEFVKVEPFELPYEHVVFYRHNGLFDLYNLLLHGNTIYSSDKVISSFLKEMEKLNKYDYGWYGSYKKLVGDKFMDLIYEFVEAISEKKSYKSSNHVIKTRFSLIKALAQLAFRIVKGRKFSSYGRNYIYDNEEAFISLPTEVEISQAAKKLTNGYFSMFSNNDNVKIKIFDHLIWPSQIDTFAKCFDDNFKVIVVERDPRDLFILDKYIWYRVKGKNGESNFSEDVNKYIAQWKRFFVTNYESKHVLRVKFEELVYNYSDSVYRIERFLGLDSKEHIKKRQFFNPDISIENTQVFSVCDEWNNEIEVIEKELSGFIYDFPYKRTPIKNKMMDI